MMHARDGMMKSSWLLPENDRSQDKCGALGMDRYQHTEAALFVTSLINFKPSAAAVGWLSFLFATLFARPVDRPRVSRPNGAPYEYPAVQPFPFLLLVQNCFFFNTVSEKKGAA